MDGPVSAFGGVLDLSKSLLCQPVMNMLRFELQKLPPRKDGALRVASKVAIVSESHQIAQSMLARVVPGHAPHVAHFKHSVVRCVHLR